MPACRERPGLSLTVAYDTGHDQIGIVESRAIGVHERVAQFAAFVDGAWRLRRHVAGNAIGPAELPEEPLDAIAVLTNVRIDFGVGAFEICVRDNPRTAVSRADHEDHVQAAFFDEPVPVHIEKIEAGRRAPVTKQTWLYVVERERTFQ